MMRLRIGTQSFGANRRPAAMWCHSTDCRRVFLSLLASYLFTANLAQARFHALSRRYPPPPPHGYQSVTVPRTMSQPQTIGLPQFIQSWMPEGIGIGGPQRVSRANQPIVHPIVPNLHHHTHGYFNLGTKIRHKVMDSISHQFDKISNIHRDHNWLPLGDNSRQNFRKFPGQHHETTSIQTSYYQAPVVEKISHKSYQTKIVPNSKRPKIITMSHFEVNQPSRNQHKPLIKTTVSTQKHESKISGPSSWRRTMDYFHKNSKNSKYTWQPRPKVQPASSPVQNGSPETQPRPPQSHQRVSEAQKKRNLPIKHQVTPKYRAHPYKHPHQSPKSPPAPRPGQSSVVVSPTRNHDHLAKDNGSSQLPRPKPSAVWPPAAPKGAPGRGASQAGQQDQQIHSTLNSDHDEQHNPSVDGSTRLVVHNNDEQSPQDDRADIAAESDTPDESTSGFEMTPPQDMQESSSNTPGPSTVVDQDHHNPKETAPDETIASNASSDVTIPTNPDHQASEGDIHHDEHAEQTDPNHLPERAGGGPEEEQEAHELVPRGEEEKNVFENNDSPFEIGRTNDDHHEDDHHEDDNRSQKGNDEHEKEHPDDRLDLDDDHNDTQMNEKDASRQEAHDQQKVTNEEKRPEIDHETDKYDEESDDEDERDVKVDHDEIDENDIVDDDREPDDDEPDEDDQFKNPVDESSIDDFLNRFRRGRQSIFNSEPEDYKSVNGGKVHLIPDPKKSHSPSPDPVESLPEGDVAVATNPRSFLEYIKGGLSSTFLRESDNGAQANNTSIV